jgi:hypothetical protein
VASELDEEQAQELEDENAESPLPETQLRVSNRAGKKSRLLEGYEVSRA